MTLRVWIPRTVAVSVFQEVLEWCASTQQNSGSKSSEGCIRSERRADGTLQIFNTQQVINTSGSLSPFPNILNAHTCLQPRQIYRRCCPASLFPAHKTPFGASRPARSIRPIAFFKLLHHEVSVLLNCIFSQWFMRVQTSSFSIESSRAPHQPPAAVILMHWSLMWLLFNEKQASLALLSYYKVIDLRWRMSLVEVNSFTQVINPFNQILNPPWLPSLAKMISLALFLSLSYRLSSNLAQLRQYVSSHNVLLTLIHSSFISNYLRFSKLIFGNAVTFTGFKRKNTSGTVRKCDLSSMTI